MLLIYCYSFVKLKAIKNLNVNQSYKQANKQLIYKLYYVK